MSITACFMSIAAWRNWQKRGWATTKSAFSSDRVCGICGFAHSVAYTNSVENALGIEVPQRAHTIRSIFCRKSNGYTVICSTLASCHFVGFDTGFMQFFRVREKVDDNGGIADRVA